MERKIVEYLLQGTSFNQISKLLNVGKKRIKKVHELATQEGYFEKIQLPPYPENIFKSISSEPFPEISRKVSDVDTLLLTYKEWIQERKILGWHAITIFEELPVKVDRASFYRFMKRHELNTEKLRIRVTPEIYTSAGEVVQLDWGKLQSVYDEINQKYKTLWMLIATLAYSRVMKVRLVWDYGTETTLRELENIFREFGGVAKRAVTDNPKCFATIASKYEPLLNPAFERFCSYFNIIPELLPPGDPKKKGKVERVVPFARRIYEGHGKAFISIEESQKYFDLKLEIANQRIHGTTKQKPIDILLTVERLALRPLPAIAFEIEEYHHGTVKKDGHVRFRDKYYSLDEKYIGAEVFIIGNTHTISIFHKCELIESHSRLLDSMKYKSTKAHHLKPWEKLMEDAAHLIERAQKIGPSVEEIISKILMTKNGFIEFRKVWGILNLDKNYSNKEIDNACKLAIELDDLSYRSVYATLSIKTNDVVEVQHNGNNKFVRNIDDYKKATRVLH